MSKIDLITAPRHFHNVVAKDPDGNNVISLHDHGIGGGMFAMIEADGLGAHFIPEDNFRRGKRYMKDGRIYVHGETDGFHK